MNNKAGILLDQLCRTAMIVGCSKGGKIQEQYLTEKDQLEKVFELMEKQISDLQRQLAEKDGAIAGLDELREEIARLRGLLIECEWAALGVDDGSVYTWAECPVCGSRSETGHAPDCELATAIAAKGRG